jgi:ribosomal protein S17
MSTVNEERKEGPHDTAISKKQLSSNTFEGKVVSMTGDKLVMTNKEGKEYSHTLAKDAKLTCDGTACKAEDLTAGSKIRVTTKKDDRRVATGIECLDKNVEFAQCCS